MLKRALFAVLLLVACATAPEPEPAPAAAPPQPVAGSAWNDTLYDPFHTDVYAGAASRLIPSDPAQTDTALLSAALFVETNAARVRAGVSYLRFNPKLREASQAFTDDMVRLNFFSDEEPDPARRTWADRMKQVGLPFASGGAENITTSDVLDYPDGKPFMVPRHPGDPYRDQSGAPIHVRSYWSLAHAIVDEWMKAPDHRANLLERDWTDLAASCTAYVGIAGVTTFKCAQELARLNPVVR